MDIYKNIKYMMKLEQYLWHMLQKFTILKSS